MNPTLTRGVAAAFAVCLAAGVAAQQSKTPAKKPPAGQGEKARAKKPVAKVNLPAAIVEAFQKAYPNAKITGTSRETEGGRTVYEVESIDQALHRDLIYNADGTVVEIEEQINPGDLPAPVGDGLRKLYPKAAIAKAERLTRGGTMQYELTIKGAPTKEVAFSPDGKLVPPKPARDGAHQKGRLPTRWFLSTL